MKIKSIIVALGLIITMISGVGLNNSNKPTNDVEMQNTVAVEENVANEENIISEAEQEEITQEQTPNNEVEETKEVKQEVKTEMQKENPKTTSQTAKTDTKKETVAPSVQETIPKSESESVVETPKKEETPAPQVQKTLTPDDLEYWCVSGGSHHIAGDRANEHGYYSSWDEAHQAFENYTKGWASVQYKISQCSCGLFYFWAIQ